MVILKALFLLMLEVCMYYWQELLFSVLNKTMLTYFVQVHGFHVTKSSPEVHVNILYFIEEALWLLASDCSDLFFST